MYRLEALSPEEFAWLSVGLLKREISPAVRMVSLRGPDGGRDAVLDGPSTTSRYDWTGRWVFQFKHYTGQLATSRSRVLRDLRSELGSLIATSETRIDNYVMLTSVPFSGAAGTGLHDRVAALIQELSSATSVKIDVWDGLEIVSLLIQHSAIARRFFSDGSGSRPSEPSASVEATSYRLLTSARANSFDDETFFALLDEVVGHDLWVFSPGSNSPLWRVYLQANYLDLSDSLDGLLRQVSARSKYWSGSTAIQRTIAWIMLARAATAARLGKPRETLRFIKRIRSLHISDPELDAWCWNVRSIAYGKLEDESLYRASTERAITSATEAGNLWLAFTVDLRRLHKASWAAAERSEPMANSQFESDVRGVLVSTADLSGEETTHVRAQEDAYLALQYTWQPSSWDLAERAILSAQSRFEVIGDASELARMASEHGRLFLLSSTAGSAVTALRSGLRRRLYGGEYPRARYDLLWLGQALSREHLELESEICFLLGLSIHDQIYAGREIDQGVVGELRRGLEKGSHELAGMARRRRIDRDYLCGLVELGTSLGESESLALIDMERFKDLVTRYAQ